MENLTALESPTRPSTSLRPDRPLYPCTAVAPRYKTSCYLKQTAYALYVRDDDYRLSFAYGNFATLSNVKDRDIARILEYPLHDGRRKVHHYRFQQVLRFDIAA